MIVLCGYCKLTFTKKSGDDGGGRLTIVTVLTMKNILYINKYIFKKTYLNVCEYYIINFVRPLPWSQLVL